MGLAQILVAPSTPLDSHVRVETTTGALVVFANAEQEYRKDRCVHRVISMPPKGGKNGPEFLFRNAIAHCVHSILTEFVAEEIMDRASVVDQAAKNLWDGRPKGCSLVACIRGITS